MTKTLLWLDDYRNPYSKKVDWLAFSPIGRNVDVVWVTSYMEFTDHIMIHGLPDGICFDHDLSYDDCEIWKDVIGFEGIYKVSNLGRIIRIKKSKGTSGNYILNPNKKENGLIVTLRNNGNDRRTSVHRIVCESFFEINPLKKYVNHKDGNRWNNKLENLEWCTNSENVQHSYDELNRDYSAFGENHKNSKSVSQYDKNNNLIDVYGSINEASRQLNIQFTNIAKCTRGERRTAGGFIWKCENKEVTKKSIIKHIKNKNYSNNFFVPIFSEKTGYDCAKWLVDYCMDNDKDIPPYSIQSANPVGKENIDKLLKSFIKFRTSEKDK